MLCRRCQCNLSPQDFSKGQRWCKKCCSIYHKSHYAANSKTLTMKAVKYKLARIEKRRLFLASLKAGPCTDCGGKFPACAMHFDHLRDKSFNISDAVTCAYSEARILAEITKCELVCANCHAVRTETRRA